MKTLAEFLAERPEPRCMYGGGGGPHERVEMRTPTVALNGEIFALTTGPVPLCAACCAHLEAMAVGLDIRPGQERETVGSELVRVNGDVQCPQCGQPYRKHPMARWPETLSYDGTPFLHVACDGRLLKL